MVGMGAAAALFGGARSNHADEPNSDEDDVLDTPSGSDSENYGINDRDIEEDLHDEVEAYQRPSWSHDRKVPRGRPGKVSKKAEKDNDAGQDMPLSYLARELRVDQKGWDFYTKGCRAEGTIGASTIQRRKQRERVEAEEQAHLEQQADFVHMPARAAAALPLHGKAWGLKMLLHMKDWRVPLSPFGRPMLFWNAFICAVDGTYSAFLIPLVLAINSDPGEFTWYSPINLAAGAVFFIDVLQGFLTGFVVVNNLRRRVVFNFGSVAHFYFFKSTFVVDFLAFLPTVAEAVILGVTGTSYDGNRGLRYIFLLRLFRLVRVYELVQWLIFISLIGRLSKVLRWISVDFLFLLNVLYTTSVLLNLLSALWYFVASIEGPENSWLTTPTNMDLVNAPVWQQYLASWYFVTLTLTTVGYGDITPVTPAEQIVACALMLVGILFFGFVISSSQELIKYLSTSARNTALLRNKMQAVEEWSRQRRIPPRIRRKIRAYYADVWLRYRESSETDIFQELPAVLQTRVAYTLTTDLLDHSEVFECLTKAQQRHIAARLQPVTVSAGHDLAKQGDDVDCLWLLQEGNLLALRSGKEVELIHAPAIVGEAAVMFKEYEAARNRPMTLRALSRCRLWMLTIHDLEQVLHIVPELRQHLVQAFERHYRSIVHRYPDDDTPWHQLLAKLRELKDEEQAPTSDGGPGSAIGSDGHDAPPGLKPDVRSTEEEVEGANAELASADAESLDTSTAPPDNRDRRSQQGPGTAPGGQPKYEKGETSWNPSPYAEVSSVAGPGGQEIMHSSMRFGESGTEPDIQDQHGRGIPSPLRRPSTGGPQASSGDASPLALRGDSEYTRRRIEAGKDGERPNPAAADPSGVLDAARAIPVPGLGY